ncbi:phenylalanine--tRNA ligase subunit alpha [Candidatus Micrarchaeota archaeon]|nr:phenylalanine--tRNA ligase subunit alpha [Candidatus Micrarchaeota archaeon]
MKEIEHRILEALSKHKTSVDGQKLAQDAKVSYDALMSVLSALEDQGFAYVKRSSSKRLELTDEGKTYAEKGTPERRLVDALSKKPVAFKEAFKSAGLSVQEEKIALVWAKKNGWISMEKGLMAKVSDVESETEKQLKQALEGKLKDAGALLARKLAEEVEEKTVSTSISSNGKKALTQESVLASQLTPEMLKTGSWKNQEFRSYDVDTLVSPVMAGKKHAYQEFLTKIRDKLIALGFQEAHGPLVELEFWNMDALFMAQDHPAREIHDVFLVEDPTKGEILEKQVIEQVQKAHEEGLAGSKGWRYTWDPEIALRLCLRSQTTAVSSRTLAKGIKPPLKMFSIGRVFRPDEIDWSHFIEFNQCEGIVVDENMSFRELLGYLKRFAVEVFHAEDVKFAPSYFPFTEPSVELYAKIPKRGWAEVGGAGMFRPEMLSALDVHVPVLAWGLGIDRLAMLSLGITDVRELFSSNIGFLREAKTA